MRLTYNEMIVSSWHIVSLAKFKRHQVDMKTFNDDTISTSYQGYPLMVLGIRLRNFEIRVGQDPLDIGRNAICYKQVQPVPDGATQDFRCVNALYGSWVSVNKSETERGFQFLQLRELRVFACKFSIC